MQTELTAADVQREMSAELVALSRQITDALDQTPLRDTIMIPRADAVTIAASLITLSSLVAPSSDAENRLVSRLIEGRERDAVAAHEAA